MKKTLLSILGAIALTGCVSKTPFLEHFTKAYKIPHERDALGEDFWQTPKETEERRKGDCEDKAFYLLEGLIEDGYRARAVFGLVDLMNIKSGHAWVEVEAGGKTYVVDPTTGQITARETLPERFYYELKENKCIEDKVTEYERRTKEDIKREYGTKKETKTSTS